MAFTPKDWQDAPSTATPLSAAALEDLETRVSGYADSIVKADPDTDLLDSVAIDVASRKRRRVPMADRVVYDLREFYTGTSQPADVLGYIHDGLDKSQLSGGWLLIPDSEEPWLIGGPIVPPVNSRMMGPAGMHRFDVRYGHHRGTTSGTMLPPLPNAIGSAWIRLADGTNSSMLANDHDNSEGKRGVIYSNGVYVQLFTAAGIVFDANGLNQTGSLVAVHVRDVWSFNLAYCQVQAPRGRGVVYANCNECDAEKLAVGGITETTANGVGDITTGSPTVSNATGTWVRGDLPAGVGVNGSAYVTNVSGGTLTLSHNSTATTTGLALSKKRYISTDLVALEDSTTDTELIGISVHGANTASLLIDSAWGNRVSGKAGYTVGGHNVWIRDTMTGSGNYLGCNGNKIDMRLDQASKHNMRIDQNCRDNTIDVVAISPGLFNPPTDSDGGWCNVYCDGKYNLLQGTGYKGIGPSANASAVVAYGTNATYNEGQMIGGGDFTVGTSQIYAFRGANTRWTNTGIGRGPGEGPGGVHDTGKVRVYDDFLGDTLDSFWNATAGSDPQAVVPTPFAGQGGTVRLVGGDDAGQTMVLNGSQLDSNLQWSGSFSATMEARLRVTPGITFCVIYVGFTDQVAALEMPFTLAAGNVLTSNASNAAGFLYDTNADADNWWGVGVKADVDATHQNLAVAPVNGVYETLRVELQAGGFARFYRNEVPIGTIMSNAITNTTLLTPIVATLGRSLSRTVEVDYVLVEQYR